LLTEKKAMFSNKSHFKPNTFRRQNCRRPVGTDRFIPDFTKKIIKHPAKVMAWAAFNLKDQGPTEFLKKWKIMNGQRYQEIMDEKLVFSCSCME
jgi:hypothetical protein